MTEGNYIKQEYLQTLATKDPLPATERIKVERMLAVYEVAREIAGLEMVAHRWFLEKARAEKLLHTVGAKITAARQRLADLEEGYP